MKSKILLLFLCLTFTISFGAPKIILKFEDLYVKSNYSPMTTVMDFLVLKQIKFSAGIIPGWCDQTTYNVLKPYLSSQNANKENLLEIWNHGYDHSYHEFGDNPFETQKIHFEKANYEILKMLGIQMHTFGSPYNSNDSSTLNVINENKYYKVFLLCNPLPDSLSGVVALNNRILIEKVTGNPDYSYFVKYYNEYKNKYSDYIVLQILCNSWSANQFDQFKLMIDFLQKEGCEFILPYEYYLSLQLYLPIKLESKLLDNKHVELSWENKETREHEYVIERSKDEQSWDTLGIVSGTTTTFSDIDSTIDRGYYYYRIYTRCGKKSGYSNTVKSYHTSSKFLDTKIIIKFDDLYVKNDSCPFIPAMDYLIQKQIKFSAGIISGWCDNTAKSKLLPYINAVNNKGEKLLEIWHHGYDHSYHEFGDHPFETQKIHFEKANYEILKMLGIQMHSFGTPYNANDTNTIRVLEQAKDYHIFMLCNPSPDTNSNVISLHNRCDFEPVVGDPDYNYFVKYYQEFKDGFTKYMILQGHPNGWTPEELEQFKKVIDFLQNEGYEFILPYEYYLSLQLYLPINLESKLLDNKHVELSWENKETQEHEYVIERSKDEQSWDTLGIVSGTTTTFLDNEENLQKIYYYRVYTSCSKKSGYSNVVNEYIINTDLNVIPNFIISTTPYVFNTTLRFKLNSPSKVICSIYDINGKLVKILFSKNLESGNNEINLNMYNLKSGMYIFNLSTSYKNFASKFVVMNN